MTRQLVRSIPNTPDTAGVGTPRFYWLGDGQDLNWIQVSDEEISREQWLEDHPIARGLNPDDGDRDDPGIVTVFRGDPANKGGAM